MSALTDLNQFPINCEYSNKQDTPHLIEDDTLSISHKTQNCFRFFASHSFHYFTRFNSQCNEYEEIKKRQTDTHIRRETLRHTDSRNQQTNEPIGHQNTEKVTSCICQFVLRPARIVHMLGVPF